MTARTSGVWVSGVKRQCVRARVCVCVCVLRGRATCEDEHLDHLRGRAGSRSEQPSPFEQQQQRCAACETTVAEAAPAMPIPQPRTSQRSRARLSSPPSTIAMTSRTSRASRGVLHAGARPLQHRRRHQGRHAEDADRLQEESTKLLGTLLCQQGKHAEDADRAKYCFAPGRAPGAIAQIRASAAPPPHDSPTTSSAAQARLTYSASLSTAKASRCSPTGTLHRTLLGPPSAGEGVVLRAASKVRGEQIGARHVEPEEEVDRRVGEHRRRAESSELLRSERTNNGSVDDRHDLGRESSGEDGQREAKQLQGGHIFRRTLIRRRNSAGRAVLVGAHSRQAGYWRVRQRLCFRVHCRHATGMPPDRVPATSMVSSACEKRPGLQRRQSEQGVDGDWQQQQHRDECRVVDTPSERVWRLRRGGARRASLAT